MSCTQDKVWVKYFVGELVSLSLQWESCKRYHVCPQGELLLVMGSWSILMVHHASWLPPSSLLLCPSPPISPVVSPETHHSVISPTFLSSLPSHSLQSFIPQSEIIEEYSLQHISQYKAHIQTATW